MKDDGLYLRHILEAIQRVLEYTAAGPEAFRQDLRTQDAVIRNLQVIGEATKNVSARMRGAHPEVPWKSMAGMRDRVVHDYFGISLDIVWDVVQNHLPPLAREPPQDPPGGLTQRTLEVPRTSPCRGRTRPRGTRGILHGRGRDRPVSASCPGALPRY